MMNPCTIAIIFLLIVLYFTYEPGSLPFLGGKANNPEEEKEHNHVHDHAHDNSDEDEDEDEDEANMGPPGDEDKDNMYGDEGEEGEEGDYNMSPPDVDDMSPPDVDEMSPPKFEEIDTNDNGLIEKEEYTNYMGGDFIGGEDEDYEDFEELHNKIHGVDNIEEIDNRIDNIEDHLNMPHQFDELDTNGDGMISNDEYSAVHTGGGSCNNGYSEVEKQPTTGGGSCNNGYSEVEKQPTTGGAMWGGLEAYDDNSEYATF